MNKLVLGMAVAATLLAAAPAMAQVTFRGGDDGFGVRVGPGWDRGHHYGWDRDRYWRRGTGAFACKTVTVRERRPNGTTVVRTRERC